MSCPGLNPGSSYSGIRGISTQALSFHVDPGFALVTMKQLISHLNFKVLCIVSSKTKLSLTFVELGWRQKAWQSCLIAWNHWKRKRQLTNPLIFPQDMLEGIFKAAPFRYQSFNEVIRICVGQELRIGHFLHTPQNKSHPFLSLNPPTYLCLWHWQHYLNVATVSTNMRSPF